MLELVVLVGFLLPWLLAQTCRLTGLAAGLSPLISSLAPPDPPDRVPKTWELKTSFQPLKHLSSNPSRRQRRALDLILKTRIWMLPAKSKSSGQSTAL